MDSLLNRALEEICSQGVKGLNLRHLWPKIHSNGLPLCPNVKKALWSNLLNIPSLRFECKAVSYDAQDPNIQSFQDSEGMDLKIVAAEHMLNSFIGLYDITASDAGISQLQRRALERLAIARTDGVTQNDLAKEFGIKGNNIYYILRGLESRGLIVRQSTIIRKKEVGNEGEYKNGSIVNTNMLYLYRYAKHLGSLQRLEITKEDKASDNIDGEVGTRDGVPEECIKEDVHIKDYVPAIRAICDRLEKADGKVLVVSDIKKDLGYCKTSGHRAWRNILHRLKDAGLVEECYATVNKKVYKRLGINNKRYYPRILEMVSRFRMHLDSESLNRGVVYRVWTPGNFNAVVSNTLRGKLDDTMDGKLEDTMDGKFPTHAQVGQLQLAHTIQDSDHLTSKVDGEASEEQNINSISSGFADASPAVGCNDRPLDSRSSYNLQCDVNGIISDAELQMANVKPAAEVVSLEIPSSASPARRIRRSYTVYPCLGLNSASLQREKRILEKLQEEKVLIKPELPRLLESLENIEKKHTVMDKKTLDRSLNKLQEEGHCKCISFAVPAVTNCGRKRTIDVVLHPSVYNAEDLSDRVQERLRSFEKQIRTQGFSRHQSGKSIPVLNDVERICTTKYVPTETSEAMRDNGFVLAKMVRAKLLHIFLWGYLIRLSGWDDAISGRHGYEQKNPYSTCKLFELDAAIKAMPLELFLQVVGSSIKLEGMIEKCKNGFCLSDLPIQEYKCLMETRATARLSSLIGILRRLKLIRLIGGELLDAPMGPHATLRHSLELKPYIEEPVGMVLPSTGVNSFDLRPHIRHDFVLASRKVVDEYWNTLEYCYAASDPKAAMHAFPGSAVHEVFFSRSWASFRVMTADQRDKLLKLVANEDIDKKISYKKCEKIAENLNLTLEQVLRVFYDKRQKQKSKGAANAPSLSNKRKRSLKGKPVNNGMEDLVDEELGKLKHAKMLSAEDATEEQNSSQRSLEDHETDMLIDELDGQKEAVDDLEVNADEDGHSYSNIHKRVLSKLPPRQKRFAWTENIDRQLVIEYVRNRAALGAKFHCTDWVSLHNLPAPPHTCRRRMSTLNRNHQFRKAVMRLCNMLSVRYVKHLENSKNKPLGDHTNDFNIEERWDDFDNKDIKMVLDEVLSYKQTAKSEAKKGARYISKYNQTDVGAEGHEFDETTLVSSAAPSNELKGSGRRQASGRRSKCDLPKSYAMLMNGGKGFGTHAYKSLAVSNAIELLKLVYLSTAKAPEVANLLAETLRRYSEHDMLTAFNFLRERNFMVMGNSINDFVLSRKFSHNRSSSPFPPNTGERVVEMGKWLNERENDLLDNGVDLYADLQCGDVLQLCMLMCMGEVSMFPCLPHEGVGGIEDSKKHNCDDNEVCDVDNAKKPKLLDSEVFSRKEKGFPGIQLSLSRSTISRVDAITLSSGSNLEHNSSPSKRSPYAFSMTNVASESTWETMTRYAKHVASLEVNGYDSVHVVDSLYRSKYLLASMASLDLKVPESCTNEGEPSKSVPEDHDNSLMKETCTEVHTSTDKMHRVTILNHLEEVPQPRMDPECELRIGDSPCYKSILPWVNGDGTINENVYKGLVRRVLGIVMQNPGILEVRIG
ncbi:hypothetical protein Ccrd_023863 [Cynara cardunculus var. scolymus]|uniref:Uncharacterized protein n=1 Tax=Cynara cardunculus var. scolymus TaxID=59895 RepID=A0A103XW16_CYNCS|nr:hypothetical protein Ccrd_023863 [Cynara cardunculus var. scolymus]